MLTKLVDRLLFEVNHVAVYSGSAAVSEKAIGEHARSFLVALTEADIVPAEADRKRQDYLDSLSTPEWTEPK